MEEALTIAKEALEHIAREAGTCDRIGHVRQGDDEAPECGRPAVYFEKDGGAWGLLNLCCDLPEHVEQHRYEVEKAKSKGSFRGTQAPIELSNSCKTAREALAAIAKLEKPE